MPRAPKSKGEKYTKLSITLPPNQAETLNLRMGGHETLSETVQRDLGLFWDALDQGKRLARQALSRNEFSLILDVMNGSNVDWAVLFGRSLNLGGGGYTSSLEHEVADGIALNGLDTKWDIDGPELQRKLQILDRLAILALHDLCTEAWANCDNPRFEEIVASFPDYRPLEEVLVVGFNADTGECQAWESKESDLPEHEQTQQRGLTHYFIATTLHDLDFGILEARTRELAQVVSAIETIRKDELAKIDRRHTLREMAALEAKIEARQ